MTEDVLARQYLLGFQIPVDREDRLHLDHGGTVDADYHFLVREPLGRVPVDDVLRPDIADDSVDYRYLAVVAQVGAGGPAPPGVDRQRLRDHNSCLRQPPDDTARPASGAERVDEDAARDSPSRGPHERLHHYLACLII